MNNEILPKAYRYLIWAIAAAVFALIGLTGWIAINVAQLDEEVYQLRQNISRLNLYELRPSSRINVLIIRQEV